MEITVTCPETPCCIHCGEEFTRFDTIVYWEGNAICPAGLYYEDCHLAQ